MSPGSDKKIEFAREVAALHRIGLNAGVKADSYAHTLHLETGKPLIECQQALANAKGDLRAARQAFRGPPTRTLNVDALKGCMYVSAVGSLIAATLSCVLVWLAAPLIIFVAKVAAIVGFLFLIFDVYPWVGIGILIGMFSGRRK